MTLDVDVERLCFMYCFVNVTVLERFEVGALAFWLREFVDRAGQDLH